MADDDAPLRLVFCLRRRSELSRAEFQTYWRERHAPLVAERANVLGIVGYRQMHTIDGPTVGDAYDGIAELHNDPARRSADRDTVVEAGARLLADEREFIDLARSPIWLAPEEQITPGHEEGLRVTAVIDSGEVDRAALRCRLAKGERDGRRSNLLHAPDDGGARRLAVDRGSPPHHSLLVETWIADDADIAAAVDELAGHLSAAGAAAGSRLIWVAQPHRVVEPT